LTLTNLPKEFTNNNTSRIARYTPLCDRYKFTPELFLRCCEWAADQL